MFYILGVSKKLIDPSQLNVCANFVRINYSNKFAHEYQRKYCNEEKNNKSMAGEFWIGIDKITVQ